MYGIVWTCTECGDEHEDYETFSDREDAKWEADNDNLIHYECDAPVKGRVRKL